MLKVIALIECNQCNGAFSQIATAEKPSKKFAESVLELQAQVEHQGWESVKNATEHYCGDCRHA